MGCSLEKKNSRAGWDGKESLKGKQPELRLLTQSLVLQQEEFCDSGDPPMGLSQGELSKKQEIHNPGNKCLRPPTPPVTPSCRLSACGFAATLFLHCSFCIHSWLLGLAGTFLWAHSPLTHQASVCCGSSFVYFQGSKAHY